MNPFFTSALFRQIVFIIAFLICLTPWIIPPIALGIGILIALTTGNPYISRTRKNTGLLLQISIVLLGFGMNIHTALEAGKTGFIFTVVSISGTLILGYLTGKYLKLGSKITALISSGTAICGGSAIAAVAPIIKAEDEEISVALGTVFTLNAIALILFPVIGHYFNLSQSQFGMWAAIAIHDTSAVVGAAASYGAEALQVATTVKLERVLWIIPLAFLMAALFKNKETKIKIPYFILFFIAAMIASSYRPQMEEIFKVLVMIGRRGLTVCLFLIGAGLSIKTLKSVGVRPFLQGIILWVTISVVSLIVIINT